MQDFESDFLNDGFVNLGSVLDKTVCHELVKKVYEATKYIPTFNHLHRLGDEYILKLYLHLELHQKDLHQKDLHQRDLR